MPGGRKWIFSDSMCMISSTWWYMAIIFNMILNSGKFGSIYTLVGAISYEI